jgi:hypothetical protein
MQIKRQGFNEARWCPRFNFHRPIMIPRHTLPLADSFQIFNRDRRISINGHRYLPCPRRRTADAARGHGRAPVGESRPGANTPQTLIGEALCDEGRMENETIRFSPRIRWRRGRATSFNGPAAMTRNWRRPDDSHALPASGTIACSRVQLSVATRGLYG